MMPVLTESFEQGVTICALMQCMTEKMFLGELHHYRVTVENTNDKSYSGS